MRQGLVGLALGGAVGDRCGEAAPWRCGAVSRRRGRVVNVWGRDGVRGCGGHCACGRLAGSEGACTCCGRSPVGTAGVGERCDGQRGESVGRARGRALGKATVGVGGGEGGGVVVGGGVRLLCGGGWPQLKQRR